MTKVYLYRKQQHYSGFELDGHAGYDEVGYDIVCAALSISATSAVNALEILLGIEPTVYQDEPAGYLKCVLPPDIDQVTADKADLIIGHFAIAMTDLAEMYPKHVTIYTREVLRDD